MLGGSYAATQRSGDQVQGVSSPLETALQNGGTSAEVAPPRENITVVAGDSTAFVTDEGDGPRKRGELVALAPKGSLLPQREPHTLLGRQPRREHRHDSRVRLGRPPLGRGPRLTWVRDAERLPNGHTLLSDSNGDRVLEVAENGNVVPAVDMGFPYEAERLGTGEESAGGASAAALDLPRRTPDASNRSTVDSAAAGAPPALVNGVASLLASWVGGVELLAALGLVATSIPAHYRIQH